MAALSAACPHTQQRDRRGLDTDVVGKHHLREDGGRAGDGSFFGPREWR
jgi:hypothetical protein